MSVPSEIRARIAKQGWSFFWPLSAAAVVAWALGANALGIGLLLLGLANLAFFRNPVRTIPGGEENVVSPADGRVVEVRQVEDPEGFLGSAWRIAIFLSIFDVHINRVPFSGRVRAVRKGGARFLAAMRAAASRHNVQTRLDIEGPGGLRVAVVQLTGLIARRIVCYAGEGGTLVRGEPYGLICYGSRVEIYLPIEARGRGRAGGRGKGGESIIAEVSS